ncbi:MAG: hypothetical protein LBR82_06090 [Desulfovibrio sp.]|nr:hypothetical protein [Desulfovibrio sp.]
MKYRNGCSSVFNEGLYGNRKKDDHLHHAEGIEPGRRRALHSVLAAPLALISSKKRLLSAKEIQEEFGISKLTLETWRSQGIGPEYTIVGGWAMYDRVAFENFRLPEAGTQGKQGHVVKLRIVGLQLGQEFLGFILGQKAESRVIDFQELPGTTAVFSMGLTPVAASSAGKAPRAVLTVTGRTPLLCLPTVFQWPLPSRSANQNEYTFSRPPGQGAKSSELLHCILWVLSIA